MKINVRPENWSDLHTDCMELLNVNFWGRMDEMRAKAVKAARKTKGQTFKMEWSYPGLAREAKRACWLLTLSERELERISFGNVPFEEISQKLETWYRTLDRVAENRAAAVIPPWTEIITATLEEPFVDVPEESPNGSEPADGEEGEHGLGEPTLVVADTSTGGL